MFIFKNIVGKLWMTIIALVAIVLLILGLFLFQYIDRSFPRSTVQSADFNELALKVAKQADQHLQDDSFVQQMNDLLSSQETGLIMLNNDRESLSSNMSKQLFANSSNKTKVDQVYSYAELEDVFNGQTLSLRHGDYLYIATPVQKDKRSNNASSSKIIIIHQSIKSIENTQTYVKRLFALVSVIGFLLTTFLAFFLITRITKPLQLLKKAADLITQGEYGSRVPITSSDEIGELAKTFNLMGVRLEETIKDLYYEKENLASVLRGIADAVISFDLMGKVIFANPHGEKIIAEWQDIKWYPADNEMENGDEGEVKHTFTAIHIQQIPQPLQQLFFTVVQSTKEITTKLHVLNGVWSIVIAPLYSQQEVRGAVAVLHNVTEEHQLEKQRKDFVANVSHELRTPLSMLQGYSEALIDDIAASPQEHKELAQVINDESLRMGRLVHDLLDLARMDAGHIESNLDEVNLNALLKRTHRKFNALCKEKGLKLTLQLPTDEVILARADEDRLEQVLTNLMDNAVRHSLRGTEIIIRMELQFVNEQQSIRIEIEDHGEGIRPEDIHFIFERFYKADKARTRITSAGTGLGLAIVKNIVEAHHGTISVRSTLKKGTTFSIVFPLFL